MAKKKPDGSAEISGSRGREMAYGREKFDAQVEMELRSEIARAEAEGRRLGRLVSERMKDPDRGRGSPGSSHCGPHYTNADRLAYYRSHGLGRCDDYPGGDAQFEADVLSGQYHDAKFSSDPPKREDAYAIARMNDGRFRFDSDFLLYGRNSTVKKAFHANCGRYGITLSEWRSAVR